MEAASISTFTAFTDPRSKSRRTRDGCWTCRNRKKKCGSDRVPCPNCNRLGLKCERETRLIWEDDARRAGMKRRGPPKQTIRTKRLQSPPRADSSILKQNATNKSARSLTKLLSMPGVATSPMSNGHHHGTALSRTWDISPWPFELDEIESRLLDHYIQRFSREYPTCSGPANPFLRIFLPLSMQSRTVLDAMLALSGVQSWENGSFLFPNAMLKLRQRALRGCVELTKDLLTHSQAEESSLTMSSVNINLSTIKTLSGADIAQTTNFLRLLASCVLLLLYEKLAGEGERKGSPHLQFFAKVVPNQLVHAIVSESAQSSTSHQWSDAYNFLSSLFFYNDLVQSTSLGTPTLSNFYLGNTVLSQLDAYPNNQQQPDGPQLNRFYFPHLIARISSGDLSVTDAEIAAWDGRLDWFPSFALLPQVSRQMYQHIPVGEQQFVHYPDFQNLESFMELTSLTDRDTISELYRVAATVYRKQLMLREGTDGSKLGDDALEPSNPPLMGNLPSWAAQLIGILTTPSPFDNALLWPIGIIAKELTADHLVERDCVITKLESLERRFKMKNFCRVRERLLRSWMMKDIGLEYEDDEAILIG